MGWKADQIYTKPHPELIKYLSGLEGFSEELFLVNDLEGIRFEAIRKFMLSDEENEYSFQKHSLPKGGLLVIKPKLYISGYDKGYETDEFWMKYKKYPSDKWDFINALSSDKMEVDLELTENQSKLLAFLKSLNVKFGTPILYYYSVMWGGDIEEEYAIVFDKGVRIYKYDRENNRNIELKGKEKTELKSTVLQTSFKYLGLKLPTSFFALHAGSFDWKKYHLKKG
jgi:hypothetical protein